MRLFEGACCQAHSLSRHTNPSQGKALDLLKLLREIGSVLLGVFKVASKFDDWDTWLVGVFLTAPITLWRLTQETDERRSSESYAQKESRDV